ncbi:hypothetical protein [Streptosporangium jomthongense]|uniref:Uncharacterized protein n=1 Tax=Streptosporangium jomthongense TaxID=1193683 RepID=A0ABV8ERB3_9ACTN
MGGLLALWVFSFGAVKFRHGSPVLVAALLVCVAASVFYYLFWLYRRWRFGGFSDREKEAEGRKSSSDSWGPKILILGFLLNLLNEHHEDIWTFLVGSLLLLPLASILLRKAFTALRRGSG